MAQHYSIVVRFPTAWQNQPIKIDDNEKAEMGEYEGMRCWVVRVSTPIRPMFPEDARTFSFKLGASHASAAQGSSLPDLDAVYVTLFADSMPKITLKKDFAAAIRGDWV